ncbi:uncharacterized protein V6R79_024625 [Siganus canaliculatus]
MTSVDKRHSGRKSGRHRRKQSDGGYSDTSSGGSFLDETDREVSNLTDRAFRSLCIGDEAVYNDSDLSSSPCSHRDRQLAFGQSCQDRGKAREELKRTAHESFSLRVQQYGQDWIHGGMYGARIHRDPQWEAYGERTQGRVSATFQNSFVETSQQEEDLQEEQLSFLSNGATEVSSQQRRSRSRVSSLIRAFNSEGHRDGAGLDGKVRETQDETSWDKSALMSIQRELSEFSTSYQPNFNSGHFPSAGPFQSQDPSFYSSEAAAVAHMNSESSFMRSSHSKHSMSTQVSCNSNFFIHSEFSPFKVWREHNRFPFQQGEVSGFMHRSEFSKWYETPMYKELSLQSQDPYRYEERGIRHPRTNHTPAARPSSSRSSSTSTVLQKALAVEKRCESELVGHYPHRKQMQSLGANRIPSQRPSTASPTWDMTRRVQDTISSVKALREKIQMMTAQNMTTGMTANQHGEFCSTDNLIPLGNNMAAPNVLGSRPNAAPFNISQLLTPSVHAQQEVETSEVQQCAASPQLVEHPPVRAGSRGATPDVRMSSYKSRATSLLFNLKDNRKRVKSTYSPTKFKSAEMPERNKQPSVQQPRDTVIDIPDFPDPDIQYPQMEESNMANAVSYQYVDQYHNPGLAHYQQMTGQYSEYTSNDYRPAQMQGELLHHSGYTGFIPENYASNQLANGQNQQGMMDTVETLGGDVYSFKPHYTTAETQRLNADNNHGREYLISKATAEQRFNETVGRELTSVDGYQQLKESKDYYSNVSSQDRWRHTNSHERTENLRPKPPISPWKQEIMEKDTQAHAYQRPAAINQEMNLSRDKYRGEDQRSINREHEKIEVRESFGVGTSSQRQTGPDHLCISSQPLQPSSFSNHTQPGAFKDMYLAPNSYGQSDVQNNYLPQISNTFTAQEYRNQHTVDPNKDKTMQGQETNHGKSIPRVHEMQNPQPTEAKSQFVHNMQKNSSSIPNKSSSLTPSSLNQAERSQIVDVKAQQAAAEHIKEQHAQAELAKGQHWAQVEQPKEETARIILAEQTRSEKVKAEQAKAELTEPQTETEVKAEHLTSMKQKEEQTELCKDQTTKEQKKTEQTRAEIMKEPENLISKTGAKHMREVQGEQVKREQAEAERLKEEHIKTEVVKTEPAEQARKQQTEKPRKEEINAQEERVVTDKAETVSMGAEQIRAEEVKAEQAEAERRKAEQATVEQKKEQPAAEKQESTKGNPAKGEEASAKQPNVDEVKEEKVQQIKLEQPREEPIKAERKTAKPADKVTTKQVKNEPDKVERVKTELAKAKAELAKIKEKMRGEQKEKVQHASVAKVDGLQRDAPSTVNISKKDEYRYQYPATQNHQQEDKSEAVSRESTNPVNAEINEYERLREKYGFTDTDSTNRSKLSAKGDTALDDAENELASTPDKADTNSKEILKDKHSPTNRFPIDNADNKAEEGSFKFIEEQENRYVYSESSKEFKLSGADYLPAGVEAANSNDATYKVKDSRENFGKYEPLKHTEVSQRSESNKAKLLPSEKKPRSSETSLGSGRNLHFTPPKSLSHKERAQTKQEILTSKIKAHAEKEISAIKEKGYAIRDGFISKTSTKQLVGSHGNHPQHRPSAQEMSKKQDSTLSSGATQKQQTHPSVTQTDPVKSGSALTSVASPSPLSDHSKEPVTKETMSNNNVAKSATESRQTGSYKVSADDGLVKNQEKKNEFGTKPLTQSKELPQNNKSGKPEESLTPAVNSNKLNKEDTSHNTALVKNKSSKSTTEEKADCKKGESHEESAPSLSLVLGQRETPDDSLQIMGIMVTVRERNPTEDISEKNNSAQEQVNATQKVSERDGCPSRTLEESKGKECSVEGAKHKQHEKVQNMSTIVTKQSNTTDTVTVKKTNSSANTSLQRDTQLKEPLTEKGVPSTATVPDKNKVPAETQSPLHKQETTARETKDYTNEMENLNSAKTINKDEGTCNIKEKDPPKMQTAHTNENSIAKMADNETDSTKGQAETLIKRDTDSATKEHMTAVNLLKSSSTNGKNAPLLEEKRTTPEQLNKALSKSSTENENKAPIQQSNEKDDNVHIGSISIRVMQAVPEQESLKLEEKHSSNRHSDSANEHEQVASSSSEEKVNSKGLTSASSEKQIKVSSGDTNQVNRRSTANENTHTMNRKTETVNESGKSADDSKIQSAGGEYFEVRGSKETNTPHNSANAGDASDVATKERELPGLQLNKKVVSSESCGERKNVFSLDQTKMKTAESSSQRVQDENMKRRKQETEDNLAPKQSGGPTERQGDKHERTEEAQVFHVRKQHTGSQSSLSAKERTSSRKPNASRENTLQEKAGEPKPKERVSTIPEISALADYARLKVIVSEDRENPVQEFPPNKKEGFFPLIQSRHSRRPVFTADPPDLPVKKKSLPSKTEVVPKVNKEAKPVVFPITEKEHQRTGMFKLGDKERQDRVLPEASGHGEVLDSALQYEQQLRERIKSSQGQVVGNDTQRDIHPNNPPIQASTLFSESSQVGTAAVSQPLNPPVKSNSHKKPEELSPKPGGIQYLDKKSHSHPNVPMEQMHGVEDNNPPTARKDETTEHETGENVLTAHPGERTVIQNATQQLENKQPSKITMDRRRDDVKIKHIIQETRASLAEEQRKAVQREEERRAREREAIVFEIKERREKQRETEKRAVGERKANETEEEKAAHKEEEKRVKQRGDAKIQEEQQRRAALEEQQRRAAQEEQKRRAALEEEQKRAAHEEQQRRAALEEQKRRAALEEEQKRAAHEEQQRRAAQEEQKRRAALEEQQRRAAQEEQQRRAAQEEQKRRAALEEQQRRAAHEEQQRRAAQEEQKRRAALEEQQRRAAHEEQQRRAAHEEEQRRAAQEEQQTRAAHEEEQRRAAQEEQQRRAAEEQQRRAAQEEQQRRAALEEQQRREAEEQQKRAALEEQQRREAEEQQQRRVVQEEQQRRAAQEEQQRRAAEEQQRRDAEEQQRRAVQEEQKRRAAEEQQRRAAEEQKSREAEEQQRRAAEEQKRREAGEQAHS